MDDLKTFIILHDSQDLKKAANAVVNPLTAIALLQYAKKNNAKAIVNLVAASQLGK